MSTTFVTPGNDVTILDAVDMSAGIEGPCIDVSQFAAGSLSWVWTGGVGELVVKQAGHDLNFVVVDVDVATLNGTAGKTATNFTPPAGVFPYKYLQPVFLGVGAGALTVRWYGKTKSP